MTLEALETALAVEEAVSDWLDTPGKQEDWDDYDQLRTATFSRIWILRDLIAAKRAALTKSEI